MLRKFINAFEHFAVAAVVTISFCLTVYAIHIAVAYVIKFVKYML